jgi:hypothetical protein
LRRTKAETQIMIKSMKLKSVEPRGISEKQANQEIHDLMTARWVADIIGVAAESN